MSDCTIGIILVKLFIFIKGSYPLIATMVIVWILMDFDQFFRSIKGEIQHVAFRAYGNIGCSCTSIRE